jgi:hypothetical protein
MFVISGAGMTSVQLVRGPLTIPSCAANQLPRPRHPLIIDKLQPKVRAIASASTTRADKG